MLSSVLLVSFLVSTSDRGLTSSTFADCAVYFLYPETANVRLEDMNALFGDATTAMPTPATQAERGSLMGVGSPASLNIGRAHPGPLGADSAIPGLDIDPPDLSTENGKSGAQNGAEGIGGWISRMVSRTKEQGKGDSSQYRRLDQDEE